MFPGVKSTKMRLFYFLFGSDLIEKLHSKEKIKTDTFQPRQLNKFVYPMFSGLAFDLNGAVFVVLDGRSTLVD